MEGDAPAKRAGPEVAAVAPGRGPYALRLRHGVARRDGRQHRLMIFGEPVRGNGRREIRSSLGQERTNRGGYARLSMTFVPPSFVLSSEGGRR
jgi:hypothetical protein